MRYQQLSFASLAIALLLFAVAVATALLRSRPLELPPPPAAVADEDPEADWRALGRRVFQARCASCHPGGEGVGRAIPPLRGLFVERFYAPGGREASIDLVVRGTSLEGEAGAHPDEPDLSDREVAAVINHMLSAWGNEALLPPDAHWVAPEEVMARR
jgi:mono/diheme cytochrome c family protein